MVARINIPSKTINLFLDISMNSPFVGFWVSSVGAAQAARSAKTTAHRVF
jgi:hypothetical protein